MVHWDVGRVDACDVRAHTDQYSNPYFYGGKHSQRSYLLSLFGEQHEHMNWTPKKNKHGAPDFVFVYVVCVVCVVCVWLAPSPDSDRDGVMMSMRNDTEHLF